jgi:hypothetical protein
MKRAACHAGDKDMEAEYDHLSGRAMATPRVEPGIVFLWSMCEILEAGGAATGEVTQKTTFR